MELIYKWRLIMTTTIKSAYYQGVLSLTERITQAETLAELDKVCSPTYRDLQGNPSTKGFEQQINDLTAKLKETLKDQSEIAAISEQTDVLRKAFINRTIKLCKSEISQLEKELQSKDILERISKISQRLKAREFDGAGEKDEICAHLESLRESAKEVQEKNKPGLNSMEELLRKGRSQIEKAHLSIDEPSSQERRSVHSPDSTSTHSQGTASFETVMHQFTILTKLAQSDETATLAKCLQKSKEPPLTLKFDGFLTNTHLLTIEEHIYHYLGKIGIQKEPVRAFLCIDGFSSTPEQRKTAILYTQLDYITYMMKKHATTASNEEWSKGVELLMTVNEQIVSNLRVPYIYGLPFSRWKDLPKPTLVQRIIKGTTDYWHQLERPEQVKLQEQVAIRWGEREHKEHKKNK